MGNRISEEQLKEAKRLREKGESWMNAAKAVGVSEKGLRYQANKRGWIKGKKTPDRRPLPSGKRSGKDLVKDQAFSLEEIAEKVRQKLSEDIHASASALDNWQAESLDLRDWQKREQIAESIQKRAASLLNVGNQQENVVNIAVLSQLPDGATGSVIDG